MVLIFWQLISLQGKIHLQNVICFLEDGFLIMCHILCTKKNNVLSCLTILLATNLEEKTQNIIIGDGNLIIVIFQGNKKKKNSPWFPLFLFCWISFSEIVFLPLPFLDSTYGNVLSMLPTKVGVRCPYILHSPDSTCGAMLLFVSWILF